MKKFLFSLLVFHLLTPSYAQSKLGSAAKKLLYGKLAGQPHVSYLSHRTNASFYRQVARAAQKASFPAQDLTHGHISRSTFQLQHTDSPFALAASGFAIDLLNNGKAWGVTAGHVARRITHHKHKAARKPHIRVQTGPNSYTIAPIEKFFIGNPEGLDIALFEIPQEVLPYITVLHPNRQAPSTGQDVTIQGFAEEQSQPFTLSHQKIFFSTPTRILLQKTQPQELRGFCGSPGLIDGRVSMVYIGFDSARTLAQYDWFNKLPQQAKFPMSNIHYAVPIEVVKSMAKSIEENTCAENNGLMMKVLGHPVARLRPDESIVCVEQLRNGKEIAKLESDRHFSVNPEKLELFFDLQENDILRISLNSFSIQHPYPPVSVVYEINVSTGQITKLSAQDM